MVKQESDAGEYDPSCTLYLRLRGLPFSSRDKDVREFLSGVQVLSVNLPIQSDGRASGEAYVGVKSLDDAKVAVGKHKGMMESRYIEVFQLTPSEFDQALRKGRIDEDGRVVRLRGLPYTADDKEIREFLGDVDCEDVLLTKNSQGKPSGEAFVRLASKDQMAAALRKNKQHMGTRYIDVYNAQVEDVARARGFLPAPSAIPGPFGPPRPLKDIPPFAYPPMRGGPPFPSPMRGSSGGRQNAGYDDYDDYAPRRGGPMRPAPPSAAGYPPRAAPYDVPRPLGPQPTGNGGGDDWASPTRILMRGLPFDVVAPQIEQFFAPLRCFDIMIGIGDDGRPSGDGSVEFETISESREALLRNKNTIGKRYIELYPSYDVPIAVRRVRFRRVGGAMAPPPAPLSTPMRSNANGAPIPQRGGYGGSPGADYERERYGGGYAPPSRPMPPAMAAREREMIAPPSMRGGGETDRAGYSTFPSREYSGGGGGVVPVPPPPSRQSAYGEQERGDYGRGGGGYETAGYAPPTRASKSESYDRYDEYSSRAVAAEARGGGGGGYSGGYDGYPSGAQSGYGGYGQPAVKQEPVRRSLPGPGGDYGGGAQGYGSGGAGGYGGGSNRGGGGYEQPQRSWMY